MAVRGGVVDFFPPHLAKPGAHRAVRRRGRVAARASIPRASARRPSSSASWRRRRASCSSTRDARDRARRRDPRRGARAGRAGAQRSTLLLDTLLRGSAAAPAPRRSRRCSSPRSRPSSTSCPTTRWSSSTSPSSGAIACCASRSRRSRTTTARARRARLVCEPDALYVGADALLAALEARRAIALERLEVQSPRTARDRCKAFGHDELAARAARGARRRARRCAPLVARARRLAREGMRCVIAAQRALGRRAHARAARRVRPRGHARARARARTARGRRPARSRCASPTLSEGFVLADERLGRAHRGGVLRPAREAPAHLAGAGRRRRARIAGRSSRRATSSCTPSTASASTAGSCCSRSGARATSSCASSTRAATSCSCRCTASACVTRYVGTEGAPPRDRQARRRDLGEDQERRAPQGARHGAPAARGARRPRARAGLRVPAARPRARGVRGGASRTRRRPTSSPRSRTCSRISRSRGPMDRLVCGDVGYGKTEVAARAAHQAVMAGKQVAVLVPDDRALPAALRDLPAAASRACPSRSSRSRASSRRRRRAPSSRASRTAASTS